MRNNDNNVEKDNNTKNHDTNRSNGLKISGSCLCKNNSSRGYDRRSNAGGPTTKRAAKIPITMVKVKTPFRLLMTVDNIPNQLTSEVELWAKSSGSSTFTSAYLTPSAC